MRTDKNAMTPAAALLFAAALFGGQFLLKLLPSRYALQAAAAAATVALAMTLWQFRVQRRRLQSERTLARARAVGGIATAVAFWYGFDSIRDHVPREWRLMYSTGLTLACLTAFACMYYVKAARTRQREEWRANGLCIHCGYDLRATPEQCPECGAAAP
jgi:hypothetical protein